MKTLKYVGFSLLSLSLIFVAFGMFQDQKVSVSRSIVVNAPIDNVFDQFNDLNKRLAWSPWEAQDSTMHTTIGDISKGVGASYSWTSEESGDGKISYSEVIANQLIQTDLFFGSPEEEPAQGLIIFNEAEDGVKVTWEVHMDMGNNPVMRIMGRYMDEMVGSTFESGLISMKEIVENEKPMISIQTITVESMPFISIKDSCATSEMSDRITANYATLGQYMQSNEITPTGFPRITYHTWNPPTLVGFEQMFVTNEEHISTNESISYGMTYGGKAITATHVGSYETSAIVWEALDAYMEENGLEMASSPWEEYENSPRDEPDPSKLITHIYMPVK